jgi:hypothetical protein
MNPTMASANVGELHPASARLNALVNIGRLLAAEKDSDQLLQKVCAAARGLFAATYATIGILDRSDGKLQHIFTDGTDETAWIKLRDAVPAILQTVLAERRTLRGDDSSLRRIYGRPSCVTQQRVRLDLSRWKYAWDLHRRR